MMPVRQKTFWERVLVSIAASLQTALAAAEKRAEDAERRAADAEKRAEDAQNRAEEMLKQVAAVTNSHGAIWQYFKDTVVHGKPFHQKAMHKCSKHT